MKVVFMGTPQAAVPILERVIADGHEVCAVWTQPDRPAGRGNNLTAPPVKLSAQEHLIPVFQPTKIKTPETLELLRSQNAEIVIVVAYGRILPPQLLECCPKGCLNVHFSLLPKLRGAAPVNWSIVNGDTVTGVTTMQMDAGLDTGDILLQKETTIRANETSLELLPRLSMIGADLLSETLKSLMIISPLAQNSDLATFAPIMRKEDGLIDWDIPAAKICNRIRGFQPFPGSFTSYQQKKVTLWSAHEIGDGAHKKEFRGEILEAHGDKLLVSCGLGSILAIDELQIEGKRRMKTRDFLNGVKFNVGAKLG